MIKKGVVVLIPFIIFCYLVPCALLFAQGDDPPLPPRSSLEELLADEDIPAEVREEIERALESEDLVFEEEPEFTEPDITSFETESAAEQEEEEPQKAAPRRRAPSTSRPTVYGPASRPTIKSTPTTTTTAKSKNTISLDLKGVDIIDVLKMLSSRSNLNIVAGKNVRGRVTLFLKDVDVWDAFEIILAANNLAYDQRGNIINVMTERDYEQIYGEKFYDKKQMKIFKLEYADATEISKSLNQAKSKIGKVVVDAGSNTIVLIDSPQAIAQMETVIAELDEPIETRIFHLDYATSENVKTKISELLTKNIGTIQVDERTNKVVITDLSKKMPTISKVIEEMDEKHKEVLIEAKIVQISLNDQYRYGIDWRAAFASLEDQGVRFRFDNLGNIFAGGEAATDTTGGSLTLASVGSRNLNGVLEALQTIGKTNVISAPRITVLNNEEAKVMVATQQPYIQEQTIVQPGDDPDVTSEQILEKDVGVSLTVTPTINKDGFVTMKIKPKISSVTDHIGTEGARDAIPVVSTSETETTVMVKNGNTIVIAGLIEDRDEYSESKVPFLGDIPLLGNLFKNRTKGSTTIPEKKELVVFLTPYIVHGTELFPEIENVWYGNNIKQQEELMESQFSKADDREEGERQLTNWESRPQKEKKDTSFRIAKDINWFESKEEKEERKTKELREMVKEVRKEVKKDESITTPQNLVPAAISGYYGYFENVRNKIYWTAKDIYPTDYGGEGQDVNVLFTLAKDGRLMGVPEILNKVDEQLAKAAIAAVERAAPFPPFPRRMKKSQALFKITISYH